MRCFKVKTNTEVKLRFISYDDCIYKYIVVEEKQDENNP